MINNSKNGILVTMPKLFLIFILMVIVLPTLGMIFGFKLGVIYWPHKAVLIYHALYYWSISIIASIIVLLALTNYKLTRNNIALSLGVSYLFAAYFNATFTLVNEWVNPMSNEVENMHAYIWVLSNTLTGFLLVVGLQACLLNYFQRKYLAIILFFLLSVFILCNSYWFFTWLPIPEQLTKIIYPENVVSHPFGLINLGLYLYLALAIYPRLRKDQPRILSQSILYIALTQLVMSCYMIFGSIQIYDTAYLGALLIQLLSYLIPFFGLLFSYLVSYDFALESQRQLQEQKEKFEQLSTHDPLTQLLNRRAFEETTEKLIDRSKRYGSKFTLLYIDLDNFKAVNDSIGHDFGDELIKEIADRLVRTIRSSDYCARLGGDEFGVIFSEIFLPHDVSCATEKLMDVLNQLFDLKGNYLYNSVSIGIAIYPEAGETYQTLLKNADTAMYQAKTIGKNTYAFYTESLSKSHSRELEIACYLRDALKEEAFYLEYQPIYHLADKKIIACEVFLRWKNKQLGQIMPQEFIPIAENSGLIIPIGNWIIENVCQQINIWDKKYKQTLEFCLNLSPIQLANTHFIATFKACLAQHGILPSVFNLELTETALLIPRLTIQENLINLTDIGVNFSLEDFGLGYFSLSGLKNLPIKNLKIDKSFVRDLDNNPDAMLIIEAIIQLAKYLKKQVIAEGIETESQLTFLVEHDCHIGQGFFFSKAMSAKDFETLVYSK